MVNKHLLNDLTEMGIWSSTLKNKIIFDDGSILKIPEVPEHLKAIYKYNTILLPQYCGLLKVSLYDKMSINVLSELCGKWSKELLLTWLLIEDATLIKARAWIFIWISPILENWLLYTSMPGLKYNVKLHWITFGLYLLGLILGSF